MARAAVGVEKEEAQVRRVAQEKGAEAQTWPHLRASGTTTGIAARRGWGHGGQGTEGHELHGRADCLCCPHTCTDDAGILHVPAVVHTPAVVPAHLEGGLVPTALHVIQEDAARAEAEACVARGGRGLAAAQLPAHHLGITQVPHVVAHCPPSAAVVHLHATLAAVPPAGEPQAGA